MMPRDMWIQRGGAGENPRAYWHTATRHPSSSSRDCVRRTATVTSGAGPRAADGDGGGSAAQGDDVRRTAASGTGRAGLGAAGSWRRRELGGARRRRMADGDAGLRAAGSRVGGPVAAGSDVVRRWRWRGLGGVSG
uniref:Uncharacterized protein n=1 Tax=Oryza sativa subsp. japonica TaxID=39947 RepID=Q69LV4_ORYSJ|nr:hypothetical protein [Oryza sativa Japonica Group]